MNRKKLPALIAATALFCLASAAQAQVAQYGANVNHGQARKALASAVPEARKQSLPMAVAVVDTAGQLVAFERMDNTQTGSIGVAQDKAVSAAMFRRPTKAFQDAVAGGRRRPARAHLARRECGGGRRAHRHRRQNSRRHRGVGWQRRAGRRGREGGHGRAGQVSRGRSCCRHVIAAPATRRLKQTPDRHSPSRRSVESATPPGWRVRLPARVRSARPRRERPG